MSKKCHSVLHCFFSGVFSLPFAITFLLIYCGVFCRERVWPCGCTCSSVNDIHAVPHRLVLTLSNLVYENLLCMLTMCKKSEKSLLFHVSSYCDIITFRTISLHVSPGFSCSNSWRSSYLFEMVGVMHVLNNLSFLALLL